MNLARPSSIGDPAAGGGRVTFLCNTGRCGSTLLAQMVSRPPNSRVLSEPW